MRRRIVPAALFVVASLLPMTEAAAQQRPQPPPTRPGTSPAPQRPPAPRPRRPPKWSVAIYGGGVMGQGAGTGTSTAQFPVGAAFTTQNGLPSRAVSTWFLGDGATLFDQVRGQFASQFGLSVSGLVPLDGLVTTAIAHRKTGASFGVRLARELSPRYTIEFGIDRALRPMVFTSRAGTGFEATRASFQTAFTSLMNTVPQSGLSVSSSVDVVEPGGGQTTVSGVLSISVMRRRKLEAHVTGGAGVVMNGTSTLDARFRGNYGFLIFGTYPINETDNLTIHVADRKTVPVAIAGGGINYAVSARQSLRIDVRLLVGSRGITQTVDTSPTASTSGSLASFLPSNTTPSIQFSSVQGVPSSLSGSRMVGFKAFQGSGLESRAHLTIAYAVKF